MLCQAPQPLNMLAHPPGRLGSCFYVEQTPVYSSKLCTKHCILWQAWLTTARQDELPQLLIHFHTLLTLPLGVKSYSFKIICFHVKIYNPPLPISATNTHSILSLSWHKWSFEALSRTLPFFFLLFLTLFLRKYQFLIPN